MDATVKKLHEGRGLLLTLVVTGRHIECYDESGLDVK
jgi:hypothetical protein